MTDKKDTMIKFKSIAIKRNSKKDALNPEGGQYIQAYLSKDEAIALLEVIKESNGDRGVRLDLHATKKQTQDGARVFTSGIMFVRETGEGRSAGTGDGGTTYKRTGEAAAAVAKNELDGLEA